MLSVNMNRDKKKADESKKIVENVQLKSRATISGSVQYDMRGRHSPSIKISEERLSIVKKRILYIPTYESQVTTLVIHKNVTYHLHTL